MKNGKIGFACAATASATLLLGGSDVYAAEPVEANFINLIIERVDDDFTPEVPFFVLLDVSIPAVPDVTGVQLKVNDVLVADLENDDDAEWDAELEYADVASIVAALDGTWTIEIAGASPSVTEFTLDIETLVDENLWATPTMVTPASGETGVANDVVFEWTNPAGEATVDLILLDTCDEFETVCQEDDSLFGELTVEDTQWDPPFDLADGGSEFAIIYLDIDDANRAGALTVTDGEIVWGDSPFAPEGYPSATPLFALGAERIVGFTVGVVCPADIDGNGSVGFGDLLTLLFAWGPCDGECPADLNGDGAVAFSDLLDLLFAWGEVCP